METHERLATTNRETGKTRYYVDGIRVNWDRYFDVKFSRLCCMQTRSDEKYIRHRSLGIVE